MHPELLKIPFVNLTIKTYGTMMVIGFLVALWVVRRMAGRISQNPDTIANLALYALLAGIVGARLFYVAHYFEQFRDRLWTIPAVWQGAGEFLGGVIMAVGFILVYLHLKKLPIRVYVDILAVGLMIGLGFGKIGCFMNGCCYGKIHNGFPSVRFPYASLAYYSQAFPDYARNRPEPYLELPAEFYAAVKDGKIIAQATEADKFQHSLKPSYLLTEQQKQQVTTGEYRCLPVHPTQLYSSLEAFVWAGAMYLLWRKTALTRPGLVTSALLIAYGVSRFFIETFRDDNPFESSWWILYKGGTISQNLCLYMIALGVVLTGLLVLRRPRTGNNPNRPDKK